ncbi:hypothetical protein PHLGIDRAFT_115748 [Phlebiopsis gigantea 11061_1 CR5-6]|uniref:U3 small nucleolar RNA-associated protein 11 n=1 Tax=Phlebiopsis gigantea (strain 11061_1 CR5-6) TaxID=745531 RepID=A0A0C3PS10_PHLG1|nr:hypothetical protein PHLGIDRAFT_115748 [Phlebiopsis gigantea 11061_1 CR5-6]
MSSLRNSLHRRNHKERSQLAHRSRLGILEKHKDYVLRARDYHSKQDRITRLRQKAADRNKDEFYFGMVKQKTKGGVHIQDRGNEALPVDVVKLLKSQDENYVRTMRTSNQKKIDRLKAQLTAQADLVRSDPLDDEEELDEEELQVLRDADIIASISTSKRHRRRSRAKHIVFTEDEEQGRQYTPPSKLQAAHEAMDTAEDGPTDLGWKTREDTKRRKGKGRADQDEKVAAASEEQRQQEASERRTRMLKELAARLNRDKMLRYSERELEMQKLLMGRGGSKKLKGAEKIQSDDDEDERDSDEERRPKKVDEKTWKPRVYKWRVERKR